MNSYKTFLKDFATDSFIEKKSEFISYAKRIYDEDEAKAFIAEIRKKHSDASHNCYAYILKDSGIARFSDDGEPGGTADMPILEVLKREGLSGVCVVVTRYFGGILLGAGGLVRAYAKGAKLGVDAAGVVEFVPPYIDAQTGNLIISVCRLLPDKQNVLSLDVQLQGIQNMMNELTLNGK
ncbi:MAG: YigZ family protein, partial [Clostridia bacterium]|nr:YigZ family protein [Clostridia bacterium]